MLTFVWAEDKNGVIGLEGKIPWKLPNDMKFFKEVTMSGAVVMGRKTYESIPNPPLPGRTNIVLTRNQLFSEPGVLTAHDRETVLEFAAQSEKDVHIIGGAEIFYLFKEDVERLYRTVIHDKFPGDTYMIPINWKEWELVEQKEGLVDKNNIHPHTFEIYDKKK
ncbi:dihydrofolate reductase [Atopococcus tabaci]|uniref:dihydrofolate reductase n=1 Tax=Atopococcus tabaci TaxID=269774 RepID=UPI000424D589|nr:dihydrofolate reductase [Atopococcus tabaci]